MAGILVGASVISITAGRAAPNTGGPTGDGPASRITVGGGAAGAGAARDDGSTGTGSVEFGEPDPTLEPLDEEFALVNLTEDEIEPEAPVSVEGPFIDDGTLVKPVAVDTKVPDGSDLVKTYRVRAGDTLVGIASKYGVSMMTVWWANDLKAKDDLKVGQVLRIPPVTGLIVKVTAQDTLESLAARYSVTGTDILATNGLTDSNLVVGQTLVVPGAKGKAIPVPAKTPAKPSAKPPTDILGRRDDHPGAGHLYRRQVHLAGRRRWQLHQPVLPLRALRARYRRRLRFDRARRGCRHGHLRRLEEQRRRLSGVDRPWVGPVHDLQPHVGGIGRGRPARESWPARRPGRPVRQCVGSPLPLRSLARTGLGWWPPRQPVGVPVTRGQRGPTILGSVSLPCENGGDVP